MIGKAMYKPTSKASVLPTPLSLPPGMTPPSVAAFSSSSDASHAFIFCSRLSDAPSSADGASASPSAMNWGFREVLRAVVWARRGLCGQKACDKCSAVATRRIKRIIVEPREGGGWWGSGGQGEVKKERKSFYDSLPRFCRTYSYVQDTCQDVRNAHCDVAKRLTIIANIKCTLFIAIPKYGACGKS